MIEEHLGKSIGDGGIVSKVDAMTKANIDMVADTPQPGQPALNNVEQIESSNELHNKTSLTLKGFTGYKLNELQTLATQHNIVIKLVVNGKEKNKTKRVLYDELAALS